MSDARASRNFTEQAKEVLQSTWNEVSQISPDNLEITKFVNDREVASIRQLINARTKAFRYAALTQILAKATNHDLNCLAVQAGAGLQGAFDARSLCKKVVVPFELQQFHGALGGSPDPYVSKPLRRAQISMDAEVTRQIKYKDEWEDLYKVLQDVENRADPEFTQQVLKQILLEIRKVMSERGPRLPVAVSTEQIRAILVRYLDQASLGLGPQAVAYSLLQVFNKRTRTYNQVTSTAPTTADTPSGRVADIECTDEKGALRLGVCVTQMLDLQKLDNDLRKCKEGRVTNSLFLASEITVNLREAYEKVAQYGINAAIYNLVDFVVAMTVLLNNEMRKELIEQIRQVLNKWGGVSAVRTFNDVVREILRTTHQ